MTEPYQFGSMQDTQDPSKTILYFRQGDVNHSKDITGTVLPEDPQARFTALHQMIYDEGWVESNDATLVTP